MPQTNRKLDIKLIEKISVKNNNLNFNLNVLLALGLSVVSILIGNKFNHILKILTLSAGK